jgi:hypothetical protein
MIITADDVAAFLGVPVDDRVEQATGAAVDWVAKRRCNTAKDVLCLDRDVRLGAVLFASLLYQSRATPLGIAGYDEAALYAPGAPDALYRARELVGLDPVVA